MKKYLAFLLCILTPLPVLALHEIQNKINGIQLQIQELKAKMYKEKKIEQDMEKLISCESGGNENAINHEDTKINGAPSKGILQFSPLTFLQKGKEYGFFPPDLLIQEANLLIWNPELQKEIARKMLANGHYFHWKNCAKILAIR